MYGLLRYDTTGWSCIDEKLQHITLIENDSLNTTIKAVDKTHRYALHTSSVLYLCIIRALGNSKYCKRIEKLL